MSSADSSPLIGRLLTRVQRSPTSLNYQEGSLKHGSSNVHSIKGKEKLINVDDGEYLETSAQTQHDQRAPRLGYSGTVVDGKSSHILQYNRGVPIYGSDEPYYFSYTHNFPIAVNDFESLVNSHNLPKKYKFSGGLDVTGLLE